MKIRKATKNDIPIMVEFMMDLQRLEKSMSKRNEANEKTKEFLEKILSTKKELSNIPIIYDVDLGHTTPIATFPIGGKAKITAGKETTIKIIEH